LRLTQKLGKLAVFVQVLDKSIKFFYATYEIIMEEDVF